jgi:2-dehydro-3-deoxyglucarate aldolase
MDRLGKIRGIRERLRAGRPSIGSWIQIPSASVVEILASAEFDWLAVDMEHGSISTSQLPDLFRASELHECLPLVRLAAVSEVECKRALDAGACGLILPSVTSAEMLRDAVTWSAWPPAGSRGVGFSRANLFGKSFDSYMEMAQNPLIVAMIENRQGYENLEKIINVDGLDAIFIGPYDLSASLGMPGDFESAVFREILMEISSTCASHGVPYGIHVVEPDSNLMNQRIKAGYTFIAYSIDAQILLAGITSWASSKCEKG